MSENIDRREFLAAAAATAAVGGHAMGDGFLVGVDGHAARAAGNGRAPQPERERPGDAYRGPCVIASGNGSNAFEGENTVERAFRLLSEGVRPVEACVRGVNIVENDPSDMSVGYGGLPNEEGVIQLDSACMDGPLHKAGAVAAIEGIKNPASVALEVLRRTDHVLLVGEGAKRFALRMGFREEDLHTEKSREAWLQWRANLNNEDKWLDRNEIINFPEPWRQGKAAPIGDSPISHSPLPIASPPQDSRLKTQDFPFTYGTIHCSATDGKDAVGCCTTTSGLAWKLPGRVGDSPLIGCGLYCDNAVGSAGATGRGESVIHTLGAFWIVEAMAREPERSVTDICLEACRRIVERTREKRMFDENGRPRFSVTFYAVRKNGAYGTACILKGGNAAVCVGEEAKRVESEWLYD